MATGLGPELPKDVEVECVAQTLYESGMSSDAMDYLRDLGSKPDDVEPVAFSKEDSRKIADALEAAAGYCGQIIE